MGQKRPNWPKMPKMPKCQNRQIYPKSTKIAKIAKNGPNSQKNPNFAKGHFAKGPNVPAKPLKFPLKFDQNWENPKNCQKVLILPNLSKIAQVGQKRPNWPKMPKMPKFWHVPPHPLHTMIQQSRDRSVQHLHTQILWIATSCFIKVSSLCRSLRF